mgnify:CR=1 FL=1
MLIPVYYFDRCSECACPRPRAGRGRNVLRESGAAAAARSLRGGRQIGRGSPVCAAVQGIRVVLGVRRRGSSSLSAPLFAHVDLQVGEAAGEVGAVAVSRRCPAHPRGAAAGSPGPPRGPLFVESPVGEAAGEVGAAAVAAALSGASAPCG